MGKIRDNENKISCGTLSGGVPYAIYYVGGSMFEMVIGDEQKNTTSLRKEQVDQLLAASKIKLLSQTRWKSIEAGIMDDGSTKTHYADGKPKEATSMRMEELMREGYVGINPDGTKYIKEEEDAKAPKMPEKKEPGPEDVMEDAGEQVRTPEEREQPPVPAPRQTDNDGVDDIPSQAKTNRIAGDLNGDCIVDEFDKLIEEEQKKNWMVMVIFFAGIIISIFMFFFFHAITAGLLHGEEFNLLPEKTIEQSIDDNQGENSEDADGGGEQGNSDNAENGDGSGDDGNGSMIETIKRTDFDPEDAVVDYPMADAEHEKIGVWLMQQVGNAIRNASWNDYLDCVDIDKIAGKLAPAYAKNATDVQNLTDAEKTELETYWKEVLVMQEKQHVLDKDPYGSIFGGRIREVRQDPNNANCIYIVTESIAGDHHRICFAANNVDPAAGDWKITDAMAPDGYTKMIQNGEYEEAK